MTRSPRRALRSFAILIALAALLAPAAWASSHREAPLITEMPKVDGTDFYMFRSYEAGRDGYVTLVANYGPLQDPYGGPNYFTLDDDGFYDIYIDNTGDGVEDVTFRFKFANTYFGIALPVGGSPVPVPLVAVAPVTNGTGAGTSLNRLQSYTVRKISGAATRPQAQNNVSFLSSGAGQFNRRFVKPEDNIGTKTFPDYDAYANQFIYDVQIPGCADGRLFVGQRNDPFAVNLGDTFDLVNIANPIGERDAEEDDLADKNVSSLILEVPIACLTEGNGDVIGAWTSAWLPRVRRLQEEPTLDQPTLNDGGFVQVSRVGMPLVNEVVIGLPDKNLFNASRPSGDAALAGYVTNPTLPEILELLFGDAGVQAPNNFPRQDLVAAFVTGLTGVNEFGFGEMIRLNTAVPVTPAGAQSSLGALEGDNAGFPNGRRPGDDVVDIELRVAMGVLCHAFPGAFGCGPDDAPSGLLPFTDGALVTADDFDDAFPYLTTPIPGSAE